MNDDNDDDDQEENRANKRTKTCSKKHSMNYNGCVCPLNKY